MTTTTTHVYFVPGMAASESIFDRIQLPSPNFEIHVLPWIVPTKKEPLAAYAKRMVAGVEHENVVLIGVSFGGIVVQEMKQYLNPKKLIIISTNCITYERAKVVEFVYAASLNFAMLRAQRTSHTTRMTNIWQRFLIFEVTDNLETLGIFSCVQNFPW